MSSLLDSEAHFELRAAEVGSQRQCLQRLEGAQLGHVVSSPGSVPQPEALADWVRDNLRNASLGDQACVRRLIWEGGALATAELRDQLTNPEGSSQRKVARQSTSIPGSRNLYITNLGDYSWKT